MSNECEHKKKCSIYIDESGDLGFNRGTTWFVLSAVVVDEDDERDIRSKLAQIKARINVNGIHLRNINDFYKRALIVRMIKNEQFTYLNVIADTTKIDQQKIKTPLIAYNYLCRMLLERASWFLRDTNRVGKIVLSARGTKKDEDLIRYIKEKLLFYPQNEIAGGVFTDVIAKTSGSWDLLQLADICANTTFLAYEVNGWGFRTPCYFKLISEHLYKHCGKVDRYGIKYFTPEMAPSAEERKENWPCI